MNKFIALFSAFALLLACTPEETNSNETVKQGIKDDIIHVTGVSLDKPSLSLKQGVSTILNATVTPANAADKSVIWKSDNTAIATVEDGKVTAIKDGTTVITVTTKDGGKTATCNVTVEKNLDPSVTVGADKVSAVSAYLQGKANLGNTVASDLKVGFQYSKSAGILPSNSTTVEAMDADSDYNYTAAIRELEPDTKYYFRSFVRQNGQDTYGETKEFTTKEISSILETLDATGIEAASAILTAKLDLTDVKYENIKYGFYWGTTKNSQDTFITGEAKDNAMTASMTGLNHKTQYWYNSYVKIDGQEFYGEVKTFTTDVVPVESVSLDRTEYTFHEIGKSLTLKAIVLPSTATDKNIEWSSDNENVAAVNNNGIVTAKNNGQAIITVKTKDQEKTATCFVTVAQWVTELLLSNTSLNLNEGEEVTLIPIISPSNAANKTVKWTSSDTSVATVDDTGKVTAISKGEARIKVETTDGSRRYALCEVTVNRLVSSIILDKTSIVLYRGSSYATEKITATVIPEDADNKSLSWSSSNESVATASWSGVIGKSPGTATITVAAKDGSGVKATCEVEVRQYVTGITLSDLDIVTGDYVNASYSITPSYSYNSTLSWSSDNASIAEVTNNGIVIAKSKGQTKIIASANDGSGVTATCNVVVSNPCPQDAVYLGIHSADGYRLYWATCNLGAKNPEEYGEYYAWGETEPKSEYYWSNYKWGTSSYNLTKYNTDSSYGLVDNKTTLELEDDAAHVKLGGNWRIPTVKEWEELVDKCIWSWTTLNGVNGILVTSKDGKSIFLRAAGIWGDTFYSGGGGSYWSSSLYRFYPNKARHLNFTPGYIPSCEYEGERYYGQSIRPVTE